MLESLTNLSRQSVLGRIARLPLRLIPRNTVVRVRSGLNEGARWIVGSSVHGCWLGTFEADHQGIVRTLVRRGMTAWDVGANAGFYTLAFSRAVGTNGRVFAFEPLAENAGNLLRHVALNSAGNVTVVQAALGDRTGMIGFQAGASNAMGRISDQQLGYLVPVSTVDEFLAQRPETRPDFMKIDVEGAEARLLAGASGLLREAPPTILLSLHGQDVGATCVDILTAAGYSLAYLDGRAVGRGPLTGAEIIARRNPPA
jgi:FkbM family methyltransferase